MIYEKGDCVRFIEGPHGTIGWGIVLEAYGTGSLDVLPFRFAFNELNHPWRSGATGSLLVDAKYVLPRFA